MSEDADLATVFGLLDDECARTILAETSTRPLSATELADRCETSLPTVYRRAESLADAGLLRERTRPREDGHHDSVYLATLEGLDVRLVDGEFRIELHRSERDAADELAKLWERF